MLHQGNDVAGGAATATQENLLADADCKAIVAGASGTSADQFMALALET